MNARELKAILTNVPDDYEVAITTQFTSTRFLVVHVAVDASHDGPESLQVVLSTAAPRVCREE